jgi:hypothetical protein
VFHRIAGGIPEELASGIESFLFPRRVDVVEKRLTEPKIDLYGFRIVGAVCGIGF